MALATPPYVLQAGTVQHSAQLFRNAIGTLISPLGGIISPGDLTVSQQATPSMSVLVAPGQIWIAGTSLAMQGLYYTEQTAPQTVAISAADPVNPRIDAVIAQIEDAAYAGSKNDAVIPSPALIGTPTSGASLTNLSGAPAIPASSALLAYILVPANATSILSADISNALIGFAQRAQLLPVTTTGGGIPAGTNAIFTASGTGSLPGAPPRGTTVAVTIGYAATPGAAVTLNAAGSDKIYGVGAFPPVTTLTLTVPGASVTLQYDGVNWAILAGGLDSEHPVTLDSAFTLDVAAPPRVHVAGSRVYLSGRAQNTSGSSFLGVLGSIPIGSPAKTQFFGMLSDQASSGGGRQIYLVSVNTSATLNAFDLIPAGAEIYFDGWNYPLD